MTHQERVVRETDGLHVEKDPKEGEQKELKNIQNAVNPQSI